MPEVWIVVNTAVAAGRAAGDYAAVRPRPPRAAADRRRCRAGGRRLVVPGLAFVSQPVFALLIGLIGTTIVVTRAVGRDAVEDAVATGFQESGQILILTGVGGSLAASIQAVGHGRTPSGPAPSMVPAMFGVRMSGFALRNRVTPVGVGPPMQ